MTRSIANNILLTIFSLAICMALGELYLMSIGYAPVFGPLKGFPRLTDNYAVCYANSDGLSSPLNLKNASDSHKISELLYSPKDLIKLKEHTPYCLLHDPHIRGQGFYPERKNITAIIGDSFAFGEGVSGNDSLPYTLGEVFLENNFRLFAWPGQDIYFADRQIKRIIKTDPSIKTFIYFFNLNDVPLSPELGAKEQKITDLQNIYLERSEEEPPALVRKSRLFNIIYRAWLISTASSKTVEHYHQRYNSKQNSAGLNKTYELLLEMNKIAKTHDKSLYIAIYPLMYKTTLGDYPWENIHKKLISFCDEYELSCIDLLPAFSDYNSMSQFTANKYDYHPNGRANRLVSEELKKQIGETL